MIVRKQQVSAFQQSALEAYEDRVSQHLEVCFPKWFEDMGAHGARGFIREGIATAGEYGITEERDVCKFIDLMVVFGKEFARAQPWASSILKNPRYEDGSVRLEILFEAAKQQEASSRASS